MKTIALKERTFQLLEGMKKEKKLESFDSLISNLIIEEKQIPNSLFGSLKNKTKTFTSKEREELWKDENRF